MFKEKECMNSQKSSMRPIVRCFFIGWLLISLCFAPGIIGHTGGIPLLLGAFVFVVFSSALKCSYLDVNHWGGLRYKSVVIVLFSAMLLMLFEAGILLLSDPISDAGTIYYSAAEIIENGSISKEINEYSCCAWSTKTSNHDYYLIYPNSLFMVAYILPYMRFTAQVLHINPYTANGWYALIVLNVLSIAISVLIGFLAIMKMRDKKAALCFLLLSTLFLPNYLNAYKVYSDTLSMPHIALSILFVAQGDRAVGKRQLLFRTLTGLSLCIAALLKGSAIVLLIAICIWLLIREKKTVKRKRFIEITCVFAAFMVTLSAWGQFARACPWLDQENRDALELPKMHWVLMGSVGSGSYEQDILDYSLSFESYAEKVQADKEAYISVVKQYGALGYLRFIYDKLCNTLSDGRYYQQSHMDLFDAEKGVGIVVNHEGQFNGLLIAAETCFLYIIYLGFFSASLSSLIRNRVDETLMCAICFLGLILFFAFWEFKSRYLMNYTPVFLMNLSLTLCNVKNDSEKGTTQPSPRI